MYVSRRNRNDVRHLYFVEAVGVGRIKIGSTTNLNDRMKSIGWGSPVETELLFSTMGTWRDEGALHHHFREAHVRGEWFHAGPVRALIAEFERMAPCAVAERLSELPLPMSRYDIRDRRNRGRAA